MQQIQIKNIDLQYLNRLEPLLTKSAGYPTSMADELSYFTKGSPQGWFVAEFEGQPVGFIRSFQQGTEWSLAELFVEPGFSDRKALGNLLIEQFLKNNQFPEGHRLRFDLNSSDIDLNSAIQEIKFKKKQQVFYYFELAVSHANAVVKSDLIPNPTEIAEVLSQIHPVSAYEAQQWLDNDSIRLQMKGDRVAAAAQVYFYPNSAEINRIATHANFLRQGHAGQLVDAICNELASRNLQKLFLKVESIRSPAIEFYKKFGFNEVIEKCQNWHSIYF